MNILNPNYVDPGLQRAAQLVGQIEAWFAAHPAVESITADQVRAAFPAIKAELTDGMIAQMCDGKGWKTTN